MGIGNQWAGRCHERDRNGQNELKIIISSENPRYAEVGVVVWVQKHSKGWKAGRLPS
jgi:hypothetical protein